MFSFIGTVVGGMVEFLFTVFLYAFIGSITIWFACVGFITVVYLILTSYFGAL